jgi:MFS family permease
MRLAFGIEGARARSLGQEEGSMSHTRLAANTVTIERRASDEAACAGKLQMLLLMGGGVVAAAQIGKAIISVPMIRSDLALGLDLAGLIVATFATLGAMTGIGAGLVVGRLGAGRSLIAGMAVITLGNVIGASAPDQLVLLVARVIEGLASWLSSSRSRACSRNWSRARSGIS